MNTIPTNTLILVVVLIVAVAAVAAWIVIQRQRSQRLRQRFGPEYGRAMDEFGGRTKAEAELRKREQRVARLNIARWRPRTPPDLPRLGTRFRAVSSITPKEWSRRRTIWCENLW